MTAVWIDAGGMHLLALATCAPGVVVLAAMATLEMIRCLIYYLSSKS